MTGQPDLRTDYERIADSYDEDREQWSNPRDDHLEGLGRGAAILDLGCGTGTYLATQASHFADVRLYGADPSEGMLAHAVAKVPAARFVRASADALPFADGVFAYVTSDYTFHHFVDKNRALAECVRVLRDGAHFRIVNVEPYSAPTWWPYVCFEGTWENDQERFWRPERIAASLEALGCSVDMAIDVIDRSLTVAHVLEDASRRVTSQLAVLDDARYDGGMARLRAMDDDAIIGSRSATLTLIATKRG